MTTRTSPPAHPAPLGLPTVVMAQSEAERHAVYELRYQVGVRENRLPSHGPGHQNRELADLLDGSGHLVAAWDAGQIVGSVRVNLVDQSPLDEGIWAVVARLGEAGRNARLSVTSRFVIAHEHRNTRLPFEVMRKAFGFARQSGVTLDILLTRRLLEPFFSSLGYRLFGPPVRHALFGKIQPMLLDLQDIDRLRAMGSPLVERPTISSARLRTVDPVLI